MKWYVKHEEKLFKFTMVFLAISITLHILALFLLFKIE